MNSNKLTDQFYFANKNKIYVPSEKYLKLRKELDSLGFRETFNEFSIDLIENLTKEIISNKNNIKNLNNSLKISNDKIEQMNVTLKAFKYKINLISKENFDLHKEIINFIEKESKNEIKENLNINKFKEENFSLKELINQLKKNIENLKEENFKIKEKFNNYFINVFDKANFDMKKIYLTEEDKKEDEKNNKFQIISFQQLENNIKLAIDEPKFEINNNNEICFGNEIINENINKEIKFFSNGENIKKNIELNNIIKEYEKIIKNLKMENEILKKQIEKYFNYDYLNLNKNNILFNNNNNILDLSNINNNSNSDSNSFIYKNSNNSSLNLNDNEKTNFVIDYLLNEIKDTKNKYENYIKFLREKGINSNYNSIDYINENKILKEKIKKIENLNSINKKKINDLEFYNENYKNKIDYLNKTIEKNKNLNVNDNNNNKYIPFIIVHKENFQYLKIDNKYDFLNLNKIIEKLTSENVVLKKDNKNSKDKIKNLEIKNTTLEQDYDLLKTENNILTDKYNKLNKTILINNNNNQLNKENSDKFLIENDNLKNNINELNNKIKNFDKDINLLKKDNLIKEKEIIKLQNEINLLNKQINFFKLSKE